MRNWISKITILQFPLKILFIITAIYGISATMLSADFRNYFHFNSTELLILLNLLYFFAKIALSFFFPATMLYLLYRKYRSTELVFTTFIALILFYLSLSFFSYQDFPSYYYESFPTFTMHLTKLPTIIKIPKLGIIPLIFFYFISSKTHQQAQKYYPRTYFNFINREIFYFLLLTSLAIFFGVIIGTQYQGIVHLAQKVIIRISNQPSSFASGFIYGFTERIAQILNIADILHETFYFHEAGGSVITNFGTKIVGDAHIWAFFQSQLHQQKVITGIYTNGPYLINLIFAPTFIIFYLFQLRSIKDLQKNFLFLALASLIFFSTGSTLAFEYYLLISAPVLYLGYLILCSLVYPIMYLNNTYLGLFFEKSNYHSQINFFNLYNFLHLEHYQPTIYKLVILGAIFAFLFSLLCFLYYQFFHLSHQNEQVYYQEIIDALKGKANIEKIDYTIDKVVFTLKDYQIDEQTLTEKLNAYAIIKNQHHVIVRFLYRNSYIGDKLRKLQKENPLP